MAKKLDYLPATLTKDYYKWYNSTDYSHIQPEAPGCYAIYLFDYYGDKSKQLIYIGTAVNLSRRLKRHEVIRVLRCLTDKIILVKCKVIINDWERLYTEAMLINRLKPKANMVG